MTRSDGDGARAEVMLRQAEPRDLELMLAWRSDGKIYEHLKTQDEPLEWQEHVEWYGSRAPGREDYIIMNSGRRVGVVSITAESDIVVYVGEKTLWGEGVGTEAVRRLLARTEREQYWTVIYPENKASRRIFEKLGFEECGEKDGLIRYEMVTEEKVVADGGDG